MTDRRRFHRKAPFVPITRDVLREDEIKTSEDKTRLPEDKIYQPVETGDDEGLPDLTTGDSLRDEEIRILVLYPSDDYTAPLCGRRERLNLARQRTPSAEGHDGGYEAISYTWGTNVCEASISIEGRDLPIPLNLKLALLRVRDDEHERRIWADAVCINMADLMERGHQLSDIRRIFQGAERVLVWLGEEPLTSFPLLPFLSSVVKVTQMNDRLFGEMYATEWQALQVLLTHPYFTRIWAVQEIAVARQITVLQGSHSIDWIAFLAAIRNFRTRFARHKTESPVHVASQVDRAISFVLNSDECIRRDKHGDKTLPVFCLEELVFKFSTAEASDRRDRIYALLGIATDFEAWNANEKFPDYSISWREVQKTFYRSCAKYFRSSNRTATNTATCITDNDPPRTRVDSALDPGSHRLEEAAIQKPTRDLNTIQPIQGFRMCWTCICGFTGLGHYMEYKPGAMSELTVKLQNAGYMVTLEPWDPLDIWNNFLDTAILRLRAKGKNIWKQTTTARIFTSSRKSPSVKTVENIRIQHITASGGFIGTPALASDSSYPRASVTNVSAQSQGIASQNITSSGTSIRLQAVPSAPSQVAAGSFTNPSNVTIPSSSDFIHICFKVGKYLKLRHDLRLDVITRDRELFQELRKAYAERFSWTHRAFSLQTVQKIKFVKFKLWRRNEVDSLKYGVPPVTEQHYAFEPSPPEYEPVLDNDFLMHRFTCSMDEDCLDDTVCFERIPKRMDRPVPWDHSDAPDLGIGWGLQLEEGYSNRVCIVLLVGVFVSAVIGAIWSIFAKDLQSGFVVASWMVTSEAILVGTVQLLLILRAV